jgi:hypothetical protein
MTYSGGCHCGAVRFEIDAPAQLDVLDCNCSICRRSGHLHLIVPRSHFNLVDGADALTTYTFNSGIARHQFCRICGIKAFYIPRSNPDGVDVNARCLEPPPESLNVEPFDGHNWEAHVAQLSHLSQDDAWLKGPVADA